MLGASKSVCATVAVTMLFVASFISGCQSTEPIAAAPDHIEGYPLVTLEAGLARALVVGYDRVIYDERTSVTPASVQVPVRSTTLSTFHVQYRFVWFDGKGRLTRESGWRLITMEPRLERVFSANAIDDKAERWRLEIRSAR